MGVFSPIDVKMFVIRLVVFFAVLGILLMLFGVLSEIVHTNEINRKLNALGEAMLGSEFTVARAVFDPRKAVQIPGPAKNVLAVSMADLDGSAIVPLHFCNVFAFFEFLTYDTAKEKFVHAYGFGVPPKFFMNVLAIRDWPVWLKNADGDIAPGIMRITLGDDGELDFLEMACGIEQAWLYKQPVNMSVGLCKLRECELRYENGILCLIYYGIDEYAACRFMRFIPLAEPELWWAVHDITIYPVKDVAGASDACPPTTFTSDADRTQYNASKIVICDWGPTKG